jgi:hypothetical protein
LTQKVNFNRKLGYICLHKSKKIWSRNFFTINNVKSKSGYFSRRRLSYFESDLKSVPSISSRGVTKRLFLESKIKHSGIEMELNVNEEVALSEVGVEKENRADLLPNKESKSLTPSAGKKS